MPNADHATMRVNAHLSRNHTRAWRSTVSQCVEKSMANRGLCAARSAPIRTSPLFCWHYLAEVAWHRGCLNSRAACSLSSRSHTSPRLFMCARGGHQFMQQQSYASVIGLLAGALLALQGAAHAQSATIYGSVGNFDVANNQQKEAHGFEVELEGVHPEDIASTFDSQRYGAPTIVATATGTIVRWASAYDPARGFSATTAAHPADARARDRTDGARGDPLRPGARLQPHAGGPPRRCAARRHLLSVGGRRVRSIGLRTFRRQPARERNPRQLSLAGRRSDRARF